MMEIPTWLKRVAPLLGSAIGGPFGSVAATFIADKLGVSDKTVAAVTDAINEQKMTPDQVAQIRLAEIEFKKWMGENDLKRDQLAADNTKNAREMQIATRSNVPAALALAVTLGFFGILGALMGGFASKSDELLLMLGALGTAWTGIINFYFGSSVGSQRKDELLAKASPGKSPSEI